MQALWETALRQVNSLAWVLIEGIQTGTVGTGGNVLYNFKSKWGRSIDFLFSAHLYRKKWIEKNFLELSIWNVWIIDGLDRRRKLSNFVLATAYSAFFLWPSLMAWGLFGCKNQKAIWISLLVKGTCHTVGALPLGPSLWFQFSGPGTRKSSGWNSPSFLLVLCLLLVACSIPFKYLQSFSWSLLLCQSVHSTPTFDFASWLLTDLFKSQF